MNNRFLGQNGFKGVDFSSHPSMVSHDRLSDCKNMWRDYSSGQGSAIESFPGYRAIATSLNGKIYGIFRYKVGSADYLLVHGGTHLYACLLSEIDDWKYEDADIYDGMSAHESKGFQYGNNFYLIDGTHYFKLSYSDEEFSISDCSTPYIPCTYLNGKEYEQRNMLTDKICEKHDLIDVSSFEDYADNFCYATIIYGTQTCEITGINPDFAGGALIIPRYAQIGDNKYEVIRIAPHAFQNENDITALYCTDSISEIGAYAFNSMLGLVTVYLPSSLKTISNYLFAYNTALKNVYIHSGVENIGDGAFYGCTNEDLHVYYESSSEDYSNIIISDALLINLSESSKTYDANCLYVNRGLRFYLHEMCLSDIAYTVKIGDTEITTVSTNDIYYTASTNNGIIESLLITCLDYNTISGDTVEISCTASNSHFSSSKYTAWKQEDETSTAVNAVKQCTLTAQFDGRIFMTGNPDLPNTVFYSQRDLTGHNNPMYFGTYNFFDTGVGLSPNTALFSAGNVLAVLKSDTIQDGSINLYTGVDGTDDILPRIYVRSQGLPGLGCVGAAVNFADDPVFITQRGLDAIGTQTVNLERTIQHRSSNVDRRLIAEDLSNSKLTEWQGYLILLVPGGKAYIADSRQRFTSQSGTMEYEWYFIDDIGSYSGDWDMYAYCSALPPDSESFEIEGHGFTLHPNPDMPVESYYAVSSMTVGLTEFHYVVLGDMKNPIYYPCYNTGEKIGGTFSPASAISGIGELLIFGTESGSVCIVNSDKRGTKPTDYDEITDAEYKQSYADIIPREWYTHMNHKYDFYLALAQENAGVPHLTKNTIKKSAVIKAKDMYGSIFYYNVKTDRETFGEAPLIAANMADFSDTDLSSYVFDTSNDGAIIVIGERKKKWVEKQYAFFSNEYCRPFGIYNISYQYEIQGRVKNR